MIETPKKAGYRMLAEYEPHHGTLMGRTSPPKRSSKN